MKITEKDCLDDLEHICRLMVYSKNDESDIIRHKTQIKNTLEKLAIIRGEKKRIQDERRQYRAAEKGKRVYGLR